jgi:predicted nucleic acid-binding protein
MPPGTHTMDKRITLNDIDKDKAKSRALMKRALVKTIEIDGLAVIANVLNEICSEEVNKVAIQYQQATYAKKWAVCAEACDLLEKVAKELP